MAEYIGQYVEDGFEEKSGELWCISPLNPSEKTPSFSIRPNTNCFFDFSTGQGGNLLEFIKLYDHCSVHEAVEKLKAYAGITEDGADKTWEVHIPFEAPSASMNFDYFGKDDDASYPEQGRYFVRAGDYPFAAFLFGADINIFKGTILKRENESKKIDEIYPNFLKWSASKGKQFADWYLHPAQ